MNVTLNAALEYLKRGFSVIPLYGPNEPHHLPAEKRGKTPPIPWKKYQTRQATEAEVREWFDSDKGWNVGIVTGAVSDLTVVDFDTPEAVQLAKGRNFPSTVQAKTGRGLHAYCKYSEGHRNFQKRADLPGIDLRGEGGYVVAPPSIHPSGKPYTWAQARGLDDVELAALPDWIIAETDADRTPIEEVFQGAAKGNRNESLARVAGSLIGKGDSFEDALQFCLTWNEQRSKPPLPEKEVETTVKSIWQKHQRDKAILTPCPTAENPAEGEQRRITVVEAFAFMKMEFPPRENILSPWLPRQGLTMVYAPRGIGKTHFSLGVSYAVSSGNQFFSWRAPSPRGVLFLDGEMPAGVLQERLARIAVSSAGEPEAPLRIVTPDLQPSGMIDLTKPEDQRALTPYLEGVDLIVVDNLSTLCRRGKENEGEAWLPVQEWALGQRAAGRSILFIHHAGKNGEQRGTSRREDVLDTVIALKRPGDYTPDKGACFEVHFEKARGIFGDDTKPFEAQLVTSPDEHQEWLTKPLDQSTAEKVAALLNEGISQIEIAELLGVTKGAVSKARKRAADSGLLKVA